MLDQILESVRRRLPPVAAALGDWQERATAAPRPRDFEGALRRRRLAVVAEVKRRSPSAGAIAPGLDPAGLAQEYERGGAAAVSVLTEPEHFGGSLEDLAAVREATGLPVLRKDFILHPAQVAEARAHGADAVLLIVAALSDPELEILIDDTHRLGMTALIEAHDAREVFRAVSAGARVVGINSRDLRTFEVDLATSQTLRGLIPASIVAVAESGITDVAAARQMASAGYHAVLVGQAAVRAPAPSSFIAELAAIR